MTTRAATVVNLCDMVHGQESDLFALLTTKELLTTRDGKPYHRVGFRDAGREISFPIWQDSPWADECRQSWSPGVCYKIRAIYRETNYGPQLEIRKIRPVAEADSADGYDPQMFLPRSRSEPAAMFAQLVELVDDGVVEPPLRRLVQTILVENRERLLTLPAATRNHHAYVGGWLEHVVSVSRTAVYLAEKYDTQYPDLQPPLNRSLLIAGAVLHDIGKLQELQWQAEGAVLTPAGALVGHILQGRDLVREAAARQAAIGEPLPPALLLGLEHIIVSHQRLPEWGSPKPPMTPEALLVHYADDVDAKFQMYYGILRDDRSTGPLTSSKNVLSQRLYRGDYTAAGLE